MGGRGSVSGLGSKQQTREQPKIKTTQEQERIIGFVDKQINVDLNRWRDDFTAQFEVSDGVLVYWKDIPATIRQEINNLAKHYKGDKELDIESVGVWGKLIKFRSKR